MPSKKAVLPFIALAAIAATGFAAGDSSTSGGFNRLSNAGVLTTVHGHQAYRLGTRGSDTFYRLPNPTYGMCYAIAKEATILAGWCPSTTFPSASQPAVAYPGIQADQARRATLFRLGGIAADGIETAELVNPAGEVVASDRVQDNMFALDVAGKRFDRGSTIVYRNRAGTAVFADQY